MMKQNNKVILHITESGAKEQRTFNVTVGNDVSLNELEMGITNVMYRLIIKYMEGIGLKENRDNFNRISDQYGDAVKVHTGVIYDLEHPDEWGDD